MQKKRQSMANRGIVQDKDVFSMPKVLDNYYRRVYKYSQQEDGVQENKISQPG